jgi:hypothetical protein
MRNQLIEIINNTNNKHISQAIKKNTKLHNEINQCFGSSIAEKAYNYLYPDRNTCSFGQPKRFESIIKGYRFCAPAGKCKCAKLSVSKSVSNAKQSHTLEQKQNINRRREHTLFSKYGVKNAGQTDQARQKHQQFYQDSQKVHNTNCAIKKTKYQKYGNENYNNPVKIKKSLKAKYNSSYLSEKYNNSSYEILNHAEQLRTLYLTHSAEQIADTLNVHVQTVYRYLNKHSIRVPYRSSEETEIVEFLKSLGITNIVRNSRSLIPTGKEIDIFLPDHNLAIEYNGVYWHHEDVDHITRSYHSSKYFECQKKQIQLITVFSNFWKSKPDTVKNILINRLGLNQNKIAARKCTIAQLSSKETKDFLEKYHIQGYTPAGVCLGLCYQNQLVAVMTFAKSRIAMGNKKSGYELVRYASSTRVVGGAGKLLKYFTRTHSNQEIYSYSNNEWSDGNLYNSLGFDLVKQIPPSYWYLKPREEKLIHRFNFSKQKLIKMGFDPNKTEKQITAEMGLLKVWDCGKKLWVYRNNKSVTEDTQSQTHD